MPAGDHDAQRAIDPGLVLVADHARAAGAQRALGGLERLAVGDLQADVVVAAVLGLDQHELVMTAVLMFVVMAVATDTRAVGPAAAIAIGGTVALDALFGGGVTGASMNPARSFGPALVASVWTDFWIYLLAPATGALLGALLYGLLRERGTGVPREAPE